MPASAVPAGRVPGLAPAVYRRRRLLAGLLVSVVIALGAIMLVGGRAAAGGEAVVDPSVRTVYVVAEGDTLWSIATRLAPDRDPRISVSELRRAAGGSALQPGQRIALPPSLQRR